MNTLGVNAAFHDSAACLVRDGVVVAAAEEERFTRIKHGKRPTPFSAYELPYHAIDYCLSEAQIHLAHVDHVAYSFDPFLLLGRDRGAAALTLPLEPSAHAAPEGWWYGPWDPLFVASVVNAPRQLAGGVPHHLRARFEGTRHDGPWRWHFVEHHIAHAASAFHASPFGRAAVLTLDGRGERATTTYHLGAETDLEHLAQVEMPHSLGILYERVTGYLGFLHASDEYKVMALASYGRPRHAAVFRQAVEVRDDGAYVVHPLDLEARFGPARRRGEPLEARHYDVASSLQLVLEETVLALCRWLRGASGCADLCLAGGVALNCVLNGRLERAGVFDRIWVQPAAGDAGTALGAALWVDARARRGGRRFVMDHAFWGPAFSNEEIERTLRWAKLAYRRPRDLVEDAADLLAAQKIVGWFQGRMEFGPRALGARSILASPTDPGMQARLNDIKDREDFRPVAPAVLEEAAAEWFEERAPSPFMLFVYPVRPEAADRIPAARHVDGTARVQTVTRAQHPRYYDLLRAFQRRTGVPVLINTSFNSRGDPIVCTPRDAIATFMTTPLDALAIGDFVVEKRAA